jgi:3-deoxy-manno-octulosonate cytidylyltransferase (CMP-KDO synthetase)
MRESPSARFAAFTRDDVRLTSTDHVSGTDRIAEVVAAEAWPDRHHRRQPAGRRAVDALRSCSQQVAQTLIEHPLAEVATLSAPLSDTGQLFDPNIVKVVSDGQGYALYFSRATVPWRRGVFDPSLPVESDWLDGMQRHIGLYAYRAGFLAGYAELAEAPIERMESLEQLRVLWHGGRIAVTEARAEPPAGVDTEADLGRVRTALGHSA